MSGIVAEVGAHVKIDLIQFKVGSRGCVDKRWPSQVSGIS